MPKLALHPLTQTTLQQFAEQTPHALLILGPEGMGKLAVARQFARSILGINTDAEFDRYPYVRILSPDGQSISIEAIRELLQFTKLKIAGDSPVQRVIILDQAQTMTTEAQNALLKLLEEPPVGTVLILNATNAQDLLPTIRSRAQQLQLQQPERKQLLEHFATLNSDDKEVQQAYLMSGGLPGLMHALLQEEEHPLALAAQQARQLLQTKQFERLVQVDALAKQKQDALRMLFILQQMAHAAIGQSAEKGPAAIARWQKILTAAYEAERALLASAQPKLVLTNLMLVL